MALRDSRELQLFNEIKQRELHAYKDKYRKTLKEWEKFINGQDDIDASVIPDDVLAAWKRCRSYGLDPLKLPEKRILTDQQLQDLLDRNREFIDVSRPFISNLYQFLKGSRLHVVLFDHTGYLLEIMGDHDIAELMRQADGIVGALWNEQSGGHNVSGTIVEVKKPIQIFGSQHYIKAYHGETGSGAPIFSPEGKFLGGITLSGRNFRVNPHTLGMAVAAAHAVENELRTRQAFTECQMAYSFQKTVISSIMEALITIDRQGTISLINDAARKIFSVHPLPMEGALLSKILGKENAALLKLIESQDSLTDKEVRIFSQNALNDYLMTVSSIVSSDNQSTGKIIVLNEIKRAKTMVTKILGANAVFRFEDICGRNSRFLVTIEQAKMVARNDSNILLLGKSGTGKDIFAQSIHNASHREKSPYVAINCGAIPRDLIASELFGYEEGAFTGSRRGGNQGKFELAEGGTIFLDEIAEMPLELQTALLRVIEDKSVTRIGGRQTRKINVRIIAATNKNLREEIAKGNFREDLYYRINVFNIELISLSERPDDIPLLAHWFIKKHEDILSKRINRVDEGIIDAFLHYPWPGNVRELQNVIERMMNFTRSDELTLDLVPGEIVKTRPMPLQMTDMESPEENEKKTIMKLLDLNFRRNKIAEKMNISRATLYRKIKKYDVYE